MLKVEGEKFFLIRGLMAEKNCSAELISLLGKGLELLLKAYMDHATRAINRLIEELFSGPVAEYDPVSADIRLAQLTGGQ